MTDRIAITPDGQEHHFPEGTSDAAIDAAIKKYLGKSQSEDRSQWGVTGNINNIINQLGSGAYKAMAGIAGMPGDLAAAGKEAPMPAATGSSALDALRSENEQRRRAAGNIIPTGPDILRYLEMVPGLDLAAAETRGDKFLQAAGAGATGAFLPGGALPNFVGGTAGGLASEGAGQLTEGTPLEPYARILAGLAGGLAGSMGVNRLAASNAEQILNRATDQITPDQWNAAMRLQSEAAARGTPITSAEALAQIQGGNRTLMSLQRTVEQMPDSAPQMDAFMANRPGANRAAFAGQLDDLGPRQVAPTEIAPQIQQGAQGYLDDVRQGINAQTRDLYTLSRDVPLPDEIFQQLSADPVFQQHLATVRGDPLLNRRIADLPDNSVGVINQVKKSMDEAQAGFSNQMRETYSPERGSNLGDVQRPMVQAAREASPTYDIALDTQEQLRRTQLAPSERAPIGQLAQTDDIKRQADILLPKDSLKASPEQIGGTVRELVNRGQTGAVRDLLRLKLEDTFNSALSNVKGTTEQYRGAQFANNVLKNNNQAQSLEAAVRALPNGETQWVGLRRLLDVFEAQGQRLLPGSPTSFNQQLAENLGKNLGKGVKSLGVDIWANWNVQRRSQELARILTDPEGVALLRQLAVTGPNTAKAQQLVQAFYQGAQGARSSEPVIDVRRAGATPSLGGSQKFIEDRYQGNQTYISGDAGTHGMITQDDAKQAIAAGIFYGTGYEGSKALNSAVTREDFAGLQKYAHKSAVVSLGLDPSVMNIGSGTGEGEGGNYQQNRGLLGEFVADDQINIRGARDESGKLHGFNSRVAAHESAHRGLSQLVDAVYGRDTIMAGDKAAWVDTSKFTEAERKAIARLKGIVDDSDNNRTYNEYLTRIIEAEITGDQKAMYPVIYDAYDETGGYGKIKEAELAGLKELVANIETAAQKVVAQRRRGGPR